MDVCKMANSEIEKLLRESGAYDGMVLASLGLEATDSSIIEEDFGDEKPMEEGPGGCMRLMSNPREGSRSLVLVFHEQRLVGKIGTRFFEGMFTGPKQARRRVVSSEALSATINLASQWNVLGVIQMSLVHFIVACIFQCLRH